ncbi:hypothetical protein IVB41_34340 [Bradyrhizobium sp. 44]|uniref:hypothetical protein n=1 Tax=Bradyrhizobium sp. 44 TaxID=2782675 RepID=UPI001FF8C518|nr:hypothetical protein [Bradyrhizobium sp. 44]MCK1288984.1 hypothetical protein [Bradyrhizobium sp. 44]
MTFPENDREVLCLVSAFKEIKSRGKRRALLMLVEELAQKADQTSDERTAGGDAGGVAIRIAEKSGNKGG